MSTRSELTTTSYAILGLLAIQPWSTYELAKQMERSLNSYWPRAQSRIYDEPKRLVSLKLARSRSELVGKRPRTVYSITPAGRRRLSAWFAEPGSSPVLEFEALLKVFFADIAGRDAVLTNLEAIRAWAEAQNVRNVMFARLYADGEGPFQQRVAAIALSGTFLTAFTDATLAWVLHAIDQVSGWPDDVRDAPADLAALRQIAVRRLPTDG